MVAVAVALNLHWRLYLFHHLFGAADQMNSNWKCNDLQIAMLALPIHVLATPEIMLYICKFEEKTQYICEFWKDQLIVIFRCFTKFSHIGDNILFDINLISHFTFLLTKIIQFLKLFIIWFFFFFFFLRREIEVLANFLWQFPTPIILFPVLLVFVCVSVIIMQLLIDFFKIYLLISYHDFQSYFHQKIWGSPKSELNNKKSTKA